MLPIIDTHTHLDETILGPAENAAQALNDALKDNGIVRAIVLHLAFQRWSMEEFSEAIRPFDRLIGFVNVNPDLPDAIDVLDIIVLVNHILSSGANTAEDIWCADMDGNGSLNVLDIVLLVGIVLG